MTLVVRNLDGTGRRFGQYFAIPPTDDEVVAKPHGGGASKSVLEEIDFEGVQLIDDDLKVLLKKSWDKLYLQAEPLPYPHLNKLKEVMEPIKDKFKIPDLNPSLEIHAAGKCAECNFSGYRDRVGVFELFVVSKNIEELILSSPPISAIETMAISEGMITLTQDAYLKILDGITSFEEIERVI